MVFTHKDHHTECDGLLSKDNGATTRIIDSRFDRSTILHQEPIRIENHDVMETLYSKFAKREAGIILDTIETM